MLVHQTILRILSFDKVKVLFQMVLMPEFCTGATYSCATRAHRIICTLVSRVYTMGCCMAVGVPHGR
jgi:hypothetical protein